MSTDILKSAFLTWALLFSFSVSISSLLKPMNEEEEKQLPCSILFTISKPFIRKSPILFVV